MADPVVPTPKSDQSQQPPVAAHDILAQIMKSPIHYVIVLLVMAQIGVPIYGFSGVGKQVEDSNKAFAKQFDEFKGDVTKRMDEIKLGMAEMRAKVEAQEKLNLATKVAELEKADYRRSVDMGQIMDSLKAISGKLSSNEERIRNLENKPK